MFEYNRNFNRHTYLTILLLHVILFFFFEYILVMGYWSLRIKKIGHVQERTWFKVLVLHRNGRITDFEKKKTKQKTLTSMNSFINSYAFRWCFWEYLHIPHVGPLYAVLLQSQLPSTHTPPFRHSMVKQGLGAVGNTSKEDIFVSNFT